MRQSANRSTDLASFYTDGINAQQKAKKMAKRKNVFTSDLTTFLGACIDLDHLNYFVHQEFKGAATNESKALKKMGKKFRHVGTALSIVDLFDKGGRFVKRAPVGTRATDGENALRLIIETERRFNAILLVYLHEALEAYLKALYGKMLYQLRDEVVISDKKAFHRALPDWSKKEGTAPYYRKYASHVCRRDCAKALKAFGRHLDWSQSAIKGWGGMDFFELVSTLGVCRHCIVHTQGRINMAEEKSKLSRAQYQFINSCIAKSVLGNEDHILPPQDTTDRCLEAVASFGHGLYIWLSRRCNMHVETDPHTNRRAK